MTTVEQTRALDDALYIAATGKPVFPAKDKKPLVKWQTAATTDTKQIERWWAKWPDAEVGVPMPANTVAVDIDDLDAAKAAEDAGDLTIVDTAYQQTRSGGLHLFYVTDERPVAQVVKRGGIGLDTRVGGKGYVIAYNGEAFANVWSPAPEWVYEGVESPNGTVAHDPEAPMGTRPEVISRLGKLASLRVMTEAEFLGILRSWKESGQLVDLDPKRPWTEKDLKQLAGEAGKWSDVPAWWTEFGFTRESIERFEQAFRQFAERVHARGGDIEVIVTKAPARELVLTAASDIVARRVRWLWESRLPLGSLALIGGREGQGKTLLSVQLAADITKGRLPGEFLGNPRNVIIVTTEDSWEHTIRPRLMAAKADLKRVFRVEVRAADDIMVGLNLPHDFDLLEQAIKSKGVALVILDPLLSRLDGALDTHKDADVRRALEPLVALGEKTRCHIIGLIHVNKSETSDPLTSLMASRAFAAVARAVLFVMKDPEDGAARLMGQAKNNLGRMDQPTLRFGVNTVVVGKDPEDGKPIEAPELVWLDSTDRTIEDSLVALTKAARAPTKKDLAGRWLIAYLRECPDGRAKASDVIAAVKGTEHSEDSLRRAREDMGTGVTVEKDGFPAVVHWQLSTRLYTEDA